MRILFILFLLPFASFSDGANLSFTISDINWASYDPFNPIENVVAYTITVTRPSGNSTRSYFICMSAGSNPTSTTNRQVLQDNLVISPKRLIRYDLTRDAAGINVLMTQAAGAASGNNALVYTNVFPNNSSAATHTATFYMSVPAQPSGRLPTGNYSDTVNVRLYQGTFSKSRSSVQSTNINVDLMVSPVVYVALLQTGQLYDGTEVSSLNFGSDLLTASAQSFDIRVRSTVNTFKITIQTDSSGNFVHTSYTGLPTLPTSNLLIPYTWVCNGTTLTGLAAGAQVFNLGGSTGGSSGLDGTEQLFSNTITPTASSNKMGGTYQDVISVVVTTP